MNKKDLVRGRGIEKIIFNLEFDGEDFFSGYMTVFLLLYLASL